MRPVIRCLVAGLLLLLVWWVGSLLISHLGAPNIVGIIFLVLLVIGFVAFVGKEFGLMLALLMLPSCQSNPPLPEEQSAFEIGVENTILQGMRTQQMMRRGAWK